LSNPKIKRARKISTIVKSHIFNSYTMPRSGRLRTFIREYSESPRTGKISFIPPFLILIIEIVLIIHAFILREIYVIILTAILLIISTIEILFVSMEIHEHYIRSNFDKILTIKLDDFITEKKEKNVKKIVTDFIEQHPEYNSHRNEIYHTTCQIMETHREEVWGKVLTDKLKKFIKRRKKMNVDEILEAFIKKYPKYRKHPSKVYHVACQVMGVPNGKKEEL